MWKFNVFAKAFAHDRYAAPEAGWVPVMGGTLTSTPQQVWWDHACRYRVPPSLNTVCSSVFRWRENSACDSWSVAGCLSVSRSQFNTYIIQIIGQFNSLLWFCSGASYSSTFLSSLSMSLSQQPTERSSFRFSLLALCKIWLRRLHSTEIHMKWFCEPL